MNSLYGTVRLVSEDSLWFFGKLLFLYITIPITLIWLLIGYIFYNVAGLAIKGFAKAFKS